MSHETDNRTVAAAPGAGDFGDLLLRVRAGDEEAGRTVVERLYGHVRKIVLAHLPHRDDPEDLMQDVFLKVFSRLDQFRGKVPFENWVARVALFTCIDRLRRQHARPELRWADLTEDERVLVDNAAHERDSSESLPECAAELLNKLLAGLKPEDQLLIRWLDLEQKNIAEVCALTGWNSGVTRIRSFRARKKLQALYRQLEKQTS
ncbi:MAG: RNA polymerase sigma factor [Verrucomicrobiota bacterium]